MKPQTLSEIIELWAPTTTADGRGGFTVTHTFEREIFARYRPFSGGLNMESQAPVVAYSAAFITYYENLYGVSEKYKVKHRGKFYTIRSLEEANRVTAIINVVEQSANITEIYQHL